MLRSARGLASVTTPNKYDSLLPITEEPEFCKAPVDTPDGVFDCGQQILTMTYKGTGVCGDICRKRTGKKIDGELEQDARLKAQAP